VCVCLRSGSLIINDIGMSTYDASEFLGLILSRLSHSVHKSRRSDISADCGTKMRPRGMRKISSSLLSFSLSLMVVIECKLTFSSLAVSINLFMGE
jgi:hypothetical protein